MRKKMMAVLMLLVLLLTGCSRQAYFIQLNEDNSLNFAIEISVSNSIIEKIEELNVTDEKLQEGYEPLFENFKKIYTDKGFESSYKQDNSGITLSLKKQYKHYDEFNEEIKNLYENKQSGLGMSVTPKNGLTGLRKDYSGIIKYVIDKDILEELKDNPEFLDFASNYPASATVSIFDNEQAVQLESIEQVDSSEFLSSIEASFSNLEGQEGKTFQLVTQKRNQTVYVIATFALLIIIALLLLIVTGKISFKGKKHV